MQKAVAISAVVLCLAACGQALAINKCTDAKTGKVVYSDAVCPQTGQETKMDWAPRASTNTVDSFIDPNKAHLRDPNRKMAGPSQAAPLLSIYGQWMDAEKLANVTARIALAGPVSALQQLRRNAENVAVHACMQPAKDALVKLVTANTTSMLAFMQRSEIQSLEYQWLDRAKFIRQFEGAVRDARC